MPWYRSGPPLTHKGQLAVHDRRDWPNPIGLLCYLLLAIWKRCRSGTYVPHGVSRLCCQDWTDRGIGNRVEDMTEALLVTIAAWFATL